MKILGLVCALAACGGGDDDDVSIDAQPAAQTITISGTATTLSATGSNPEGGVVVAAFANSADTTVVAMATTDAAGSYTITVQTSGAALDGFLKATKTGLLDTYLYPPAPLGADFAGASINMVALQTFEFLSTACGGNQQGDRIKTQGGSIACTMKVESSYLNRA
jgi:hypothetical protein